MKQALQALLIAPNPVDRMAIMTGKKKITIREGHRDYHPGPLMICCHIQPWTVLTSITEARLTILAAVSAEEFQADGYDSLEKAVEDLKTYYPNITIYSPVTVIKWGDLDENSFYAKKENIDFYAEVNGITL
ncbi:MAG TPA: hypothetical protein PLI45_02445 [Candidatus Woesebacteria bacterium]|nr:hypothetical protein [Candidatus Woesebacteria bacterium]